MAACRNWPADQDNTSTTEQTNMNKLSLVAALAVGGLLASATITSAQDSTAPKKKGPSVEQRVDRLNTEVTLTADQKTKVTALFEDDQKKMRELRQDTSLSQEDRRTKGRELRTAEDKKLKEILTPEQWDKWQKARPQRGGGGGGGSSSGDKKN
jgi:periplasmic protein CpxP/Spy